ncbi:MAG TPA: GntR family transcriptional regulator [Chloroflexota bacterium]|nr:GntR family transcriptional regulator [Chloroflexota bacterium]
MAFTLDKHIEVPMYQQLQSLIRTNITTGTWQPGQAIPSEQMLSRQFGIARMTVRQALEGIIREGLLRRERGRGTFVAHPMVERELSRLRGFSEDMRLRGMAPSAKLLAREVIPAPPEVSSHLHLGPREAVIYLKRLRLADAAPMALETSYFNYGLFRGILDADLESNSLYEFMETSAGLRLSHGSQELEAALPSAAEAQLLQQSRRDPTLLISQTTYLRLEGAEVPAIFGRTRYRADRYRFRLEVPR